jgi:hypothetical protein
MKGHFKKLSLSHVAVARRELGQCSALRDVGQEAAINERRVMSQRQRETIRCTADEPHVRYMTAATA